MFVPVNNIIGDTPSAALVAKDFFDQINGFCIHPNSPLSMEKVWFDMLITDKYSFPAVALVISVDGSFEVLVSENLLDEFEQYMEAFFDECALDWALSII